MCTCAHAKLLLNKLNGGLKMYQMFQHKDCLKSRWYLMPHKVFLVLLFNLLRSYVHVHVCVCAHHPNVFKLHRCCTFHENAAACTFLVVVGEN